VRVSTRVWAKSAGFTHQKVGKEACAPTFSDSRGAWQMNGADVSVLKSML